MVTPAECKVFQTVYAVCLNGYCFQPAEVNDVLPFFQNKDMNGDCRVDEKDYSGDSMALARDFVSAKKWDEFSSVQFYNWTKLIGGMRDISADLRKLDNIDCEYQLRGGAGIYEGYTVSLYDDNAWYNEIIPITGSQGQNFQARADAVCGRLNEFLGSSDERDSSYFAYESAISKLPSILQASTRQYLATYYNQEHAMSFRHEDSGYFLLPFSEEKIWINPVCD